VFCIQRSEGVKKKNNHPTILKIPGRLWDEIKNIFPKEKPLKTFGGRPIIPHRKVIDGILYVLRTDASGRCYLKNTDLVRPVIAGFSNGIALIYSKRDGSDY
jgi:hypothetical protein